ncbi:GNAT family N-acetyltransferase [Streptomyces ochraceiscleroticus]|uniref:GNAT family N-acetyltransferase n=1 Tax=Streptomyces ochraceiscleroticus TaxID=47761 RepID=A0ABW1MTB1_9ACTN|nr:GNAT family N-acyltransferase [Streptomyces ochraceiscleroticus]
MLSVSTADAGTGSYVTSIADTTEEIRAAQRLRHRVFGGEPGARLRTRSAGHDVDGFDASADHLLVTDTASGEVVGTYRLLPPGRSERSSSEGEFDLRALHEVRGRMVEAERACVHPDHRTGAVINLMWAALARYALLSGHRYLAGRAAVPLADGGQAASHAWLLGTTKHCSPAELRVHPHRPWTPPGVIENEPSYALLPPLLRGYLRIGAWMCGAPAHDPESGVADFFVLLDMERIDDRYRRFFLGE